MTTRFPIRIIAAALFALSALLGAPSAQDASLAIGMPAAAAQEAQTEPRYWQMYYNFAPPTDEFIAGLAAAAASSTSSPTASRI